jgi:4-aminobutyrate aminotransferase
MIPVQVSTTIPGPLSQGMVRRLKKTVPFAAYAGLYGICLKSARGVYLTDVDGNTFLDFLSGASTVSVGYGRKDIIEVYNQTAVRLQHSCFCFSPNQEAIDLAEKLAEITPGTYPKQVLFGLSGSDSVDAAVKIARRFTGKPRMIYFRRAYHGSTGFSIAMNGFGSLQEGLFLGEDCTRMDFPTTTTQAEWTIHQIQAAFKRGDIAGIVTEPVQGDGGNIVPPDGFHNSLIELTRHYGGVFIADEIQSGMGRSGRWWGMETFGVTPDILCTAKAITSGYAPLSACIVPAEMASCLGKSQHLFTYAGHPPTCAVARKVIDIVEQENLIQNARERGDQLIKGLQALIGRYSCAVDVRGKGLHVGFEVRDQANNFPLGGLFALRCVEKGLYPGYFGEANHVLRLHPPLIIRQAEIQFAIDVITSVVEEWESGHFSSDTIRRYKRNAFGLGDDQWLASQ